MESLFLIEAVYIFFREINVIADEILGRSHQEISVSNYNCEIQDFCQEIHKGSASRTLTISHLDNATSSTLRN